ncbi:MAG TPA: type II secretion system protein [Trueperaceae bacterium]|nr:type II secretion system protein [Trueperaceae bacterium]
MRTRVGGFTIIEVLIALAVIGIAFAAMAFVQVNNLRATASARLASEVKAAANVVLEQQMSLVLATSTDPYTGAKRYAFNDFYWSCPTPVTPSGGALAVVTSRTCSGVERIGDVVVDYRIRGEAGILGEGLLTIIVTADHDLGTQTLTLGDRVTCYDIYPSPTSLAPEPCPVPTAVGAGRP